MKLLETLEEVTSLVDINKARFRGVYKDIDTKLPIAQFTINGTMYGAKWRHYETATGQKISL